MIKEDQIFLLHLARKKIAQKLGLDWTNYKGAALFTPSEEVKQIKGTFVTLSIKDDLRGCIGQITPNETIRETVQYNAQSAAFNDTRFDKLSKKEFELITVEISILSTPVQLKYDGVADLLNKIEQNIHGIIIRSGGRSATFLPQVWEDISTKEEFLMHLCAKAALPFDEWKKGKLEVYTYTVEHFNEKELGLQL